jgi:hypothetical protein
MQIQLNVRKPQQKRTRALLDGNQILILRPNEKFFTWPMPSFQTNQAGPNAFQLFKMDYLKCYSKDRSIESSKLTKINAEIIEAWNDSEKVREKYSFSHSKL